MTQRNLNSRKPLLFNFRFVGVSLVGSLAMALVATFAPLAAQIAILGALLSIVAGLVVSYVEQEEQRERRREAMLEQLKVPMAIASDADLYVRYLDYSRAVSQLAAQADPIIRDTALLKLSSVNAQIACLASGRVVFSATEAWRTVYEKLLQSHDIWKYRSIAWVRTKEYWQDAPGKTSMQANFEAVYRGVLIERIIILPEKLWSRGSLLPEATILPWIEEQHNHGLWLMLVREADLQGDKELLVDIGIYGERAVGIQELDDNARTLRFVLDFDPQAVSLAKSLWERLSIYTISFRKLLDQLDDEE